MTHLMVQALPKPSNGPTHSSPSRSYCSLTKPMRWQPNEPTSICTTRTRLASIPSYKRIDGLRLCHRRIVVVFVTNRPRTRSTRPCDDGPLIAINVRSAGRHCQRRHLSWRGPELNLSERQSKELVSITGAERREKVRRLIHRVGYYGPPATVRAARGVCGGPRIDGIGYYYGCEAHRTVPGDEWKE